MRIVYHRTCLFCLSSNTALAINPPITNLKLDSSQADSFENTQALIDQADKLYWQEKYNDALPLYQQISDLTLECLPNERSLAKPGPWKLVTTNEVDPPGWVWLDPTQELKGIIVCVHGLGLTARSFDSFAKQIIESGYSVIAFNVRGFGSYISSKAGGQS